MGKRQAEEAAPEQAEAPLPKQARAADAPDVSWTVTRGPQLIEIGGKSCQHEVAWPGRVDDPALFKPPAKSAKPPAKQYPFAVDPFQQTAINCLEAGHSVLVAAHTSAGKTVVAEYAFAMALRDKQRVIYTSPLKALSNQKYREFYEEFGDVGLMTGDVTINPDASCLVMTTEILRQMLYNDSPTVREAALVVYDEIHYLRDKERGVVWEESIVLMPKSVRFAFLSATIPNAAEFAQWIAKVHRCPCHVVYTDFRPTPLQHYVFPAKGQGLYMVVDERSVFKEEAFSKAVAALQEEAAKPAAKGGKQTKGGGVGPEGEESDIFKIVRLIMERGYDPAIVFSFSKRECEDLAQQMLGLDLNDEREKALVQGIFDSAMDGLPGEDRALAQIQGVLPMLLRGIGVHHSGLLPIVKEVIEILFQEGLLKVLFATETFSTGLNMPAKTVVFTSARKFDGAGFRWVSSGEYIQMSGRAGRRGKDDRGIVILMLDAKMDPAVARGMLRGAPDTLHSEFRLGNCTLLQLARGGAALAPRELLAASYKQFQVELALPRLQQRVAELQAEHDAITVEDEPAVADFLETLAAAAEVRAEMAAAVHDYRAAVPFLQPGRLVRLLSHISGTTQEEPGETQGDVVPGSSGRPMLRSEQAAWGAVVSFERLGGRPAEEAEADEPAETSGRRKEASWVVDVLVNCAPRPPPGQGPPRQFRLVGPDEAGTAQVVMLPLSQVTALSSVRVFIHKDLRSQEACEHGLRAIAEVQKRMPEVPLLTDKDLQLDRSQHKKQRRKLAKFEERLAGSPLAAAADLLPRLRTLQAKRALAARVRLARREARAAGDVILADELRHRERLLHRLGYLQDGLVTQKGRVAAELQSADELVLTELIFNGNMKAYTAAQIVALVSCFVWQDRQERPKRLPDRLAGPFGELQQAARLIAKAAAECKLPLETEAYLASFRPELMEFAADWASGARFVDIQQRSDFFEGSLVRAFRRIEEVLRQLAAGVRVIGDAELEARFEEAGESIRRGVVFAASLYL